MDLSVIIPSYNGYQLLTESLPPLFESVRFSKIKDYEVIVVDNGSTPSGILRTSPLTTGGSTPSGILRTSPLTTGGSAPSGILRTSPLTTGGSADNTSSLVNNYSHIQYLYFPQPLGFAKATNIGIKKAKGKYILLLNNDCHVQKDTIHKLIRFLESHPDVYFTQPIIEESGQQVIGYKIDLSIAKAFPICKPTLSHDKVMQMHSYVNQSNLFSIFNNHNYIYGLSATCLLVRKEVFDRIGLFDESFHSYLEDIDWCFRAVKEGLVFSPCLETAVTHLQLQTSQKMGSYKAKRDFINWVRIIIKHYPKKYVITNFIPLFIERLRNFWGIVKN